MARAGVDPGRVEVVNKRPRYEYLQLHGKSTSRLDTFPFNGHTTVCDALWMGVPSIMLEGSSYASRFGGSALLNLGLENLIARIARTICRDRRGFGRRPASAVGLRRGLRGRMQDSPLLDRGALRETWNRPTAGCGTSGARRVKQQSAVSNQAVVCRAFPKRCKPAWSIHRAGRLLEAEHYYRRVLQAQPRHAAHHLLGLLAFQGGKHDLAVKHCTRRYAWTDSIADFHTALGTRIEN